MLNKAAFLRVEVRIALALKISFAIIIYFRGLMSQSRIEVNKRKKISIRMHLIIFNN